MCVQLSFSLLPASAKIAMFCWTNVVPVTTGGGGAAYHGVTALIMLGKKLVCPKSFGWIHHMVTIEKNQGVSPRGVEGKAKKLSSAALSLSCASFGPMKALRTSQLFPISSPGTSWCQNNYCPLAVDENTLCSVMPLWCGFVGGLWSVFMWVLIWWSHDNIIPHWSQCGNRFTLTVGLFPAHFPRTEWTLKPSYT